MNPYRIEDYSYRLVSKDDGWFLQPVIGGHPIGGYLFSTAYGKTREVVRQAAEATGEAWLRSLRKRPRSYLPWKDHDGIYMLGPDDDLLIGKLP